MTCAIPILQDIFNKDTKTDDFPNSNYKELSGRILVRVVFVLSKMSLFIDKNDVNQNSIP